MGTVCSSAKSKYKMKNNPNEENYNNATIDNNTSNHNNNQEELESNGKQDLDNMYFSKDEQKIIKALYMNDDKNHKKHAVLTYKKGKLIGEGSFGRVYEGFDQESGRMLAIKELDLKRIPDKLLKKKIDSFKSEINLLSKLNHPSIISYYGVKQTEDYLDIFLEFIGGGSLSKMIDTYGPLPENIISKYTRSILLGLEYLHANQVMHRDIKGGNILVDHDGSVKLTDFGGSKQILEAETNAQTSLKGTPHWMAPETIKEGKYSRFSDIWSLGCTVIEMATGKPPFSEFSNAMSALYNIMNAKEPPSIPDNLHEDTKDFILKCLQINPIHRWNVRRLLKHPFILNVNNISNSRLLYKLESNKNIKQMVGSDQNTMQFSVNVNSTINENDFSKGKFIEKNTELQHNHQFFNTDKNDLNQIRDNNEEGKVLSSTHDQSKLKDKLNRRIVIDKNSPNKRNSNRPKIIIKS